MTRTGQAAIDYARSRVGPNAMPASGYCLQFVRECFAIPAVYASAIDAWNGSKTKHPGDRNPPRAVPLFFTTPSVYDHIVFLGDPGEIITTFNADVRRYTSSTTSGAIDAIIRDFGPGSYLGWTEDLNGYRVLVDSGFAPTPPTGTDDDMPLVIQSPGRGLGVIIGSRVVSLNNTSSADSIQAATGSGRAQITDADFDQLRYSGTAPLLIREPSRGYGLVTGAQAIGLGDMATVNALQGAGVAVIDVTAADFDRLAAGISGAIPTPPPSS